MVRGGKRRCSTMLGCGVIKLDGANTAVSPETGPQKAHHATRTRLAAPWRISTGNLVGGDTLAGVAAAAPQWPASESESVSLAWWQASRSAEENRQDWKIKWLHHCN
jgi:hypothetical protein